MSDSTKQQAYSQAINLWKRMLKINQTLNNPKAFGIQRVIYYRNLGGTLSEQESDLFSQEEILDRLKIRYANLMDEFENLRGTLSSQQIKSAQEMAAKELQK